jgi:hypothetical protein
MKIGKNNEVIIAKIARSDFPHKWWFTRPFHSCVDFSLIYFRPSLEPDIMTPITHHLGQRLTSPGSDPAACRVLHKSLRALNAILKELSHIKMMTSVKTLGQVRNYPAHRLFTITSNLSVSVHRSHSLPTI